MDTGELFRNRYVAVKNAMSKAKNPEFKELWKNVLKGLIAAESKMATGFLDKKDDSNDTV